MKSNGISFRGLAIARPTIKINRARPNTGELAATSASKIPDTPTCDQVEINELGLEIPRDATLATERTRNGRSVIATTCANAVSVIDAVSAGQSAYARDAVMRIGLLLEISPER